MAEKGRGRRVQKLLTSRWRQHNVWAAPPLQLLGLWTFLVILTGVLSSSSGEIKTVNMSANMILLITDEWNSKLFLQVVWKVWADYYLLWSVMIIFELQTFCTHMSSMTIIHFLLVEQIITKSQHHWLTHGQTGEPSRSFVIIYPQWSGPLWGGSHSEDESHDACLISLPWPQSRTRWVRWKWALDRPATSAEEGCST